MQWLIQRRWFATSTCCGLATNGTSPASACSHIIVSVAGTSPSQPAMKPSSFSCESAKQPVVRSCVTRSKQRTVQASSRWRAHTSRRATRTVAAACRSADVGSTTASAAPTRSATSPASCGAPAGTAFIASMTSASGTSTRSTPQASFTAGAVGMLATSQSEGLPMTPSRRPARRARAAAAVATSWNARSPSGPSARNTISPRRPSCCRRARISRQAGNEFWSGCASSTTGSVESPAASRAACSVPPVSTSSTGSSPAATFVPHAPRRCSRPAARQRAENAAASASRAGADRKSEATGVMSSMVNPSVTARGPARRPAAPVPRATTTAAGRARRRPGPSPATTPG